MTPYLDLEPCDYFDSRSVYVAPELIIHYIEEHRYLPPPAFCGAVVACPPINSAVYFQALRRNPIGDVAKDVPRTWWRLLQPITPILAKVLVRR
jgi:hypothetical protein